MNFTEEMQLGDIMTCSWSDNYLPVRIANAYGFGLLGLKLQYLEVAELYKDPPLLE